MPVAARRKREVTHIREDILRAAARAIAREGVESVTVHDIAREASYTTASLYKYFKGKDEIISSLIRMIRDEISAVFAASMPKGLTFPQQLELLLRRLLEKAESWVDTFEPLAAIALRSDRESRRRRLKYGIPASNPFHHHLTKWLAEVASPADLGGRNVDEVAFALMGLMFGFFEPWYSGGREGQLGDRVGTIVDLFLHGVRGEPRDGGTADAPKSRP